MKSSVIVTTYNSSNSIFLILRNLLSIINYTDEIIIVDDGSKDETTSIIEKIKDKRLKLIKVKHIGRAKALNIAIQNSSGEIIFINDSDDLSNNTRIKDSLNLISNGYDAVFGQGVIFDDFKIENIKLVLNQLDIKNKNIKENISILKDKTLFKTLNLHHSSLAIKKEKLLKIGSYNEELDICIDLDLYYRFLMNKLNVCISNKKFIARYYGKTRFYSNYPSKKYAKNLLKLRAKYRKILRPPLFTLIYDLKIFLESFLIK
tara:strand:- start:2667 stop:3449 length:783 start_codon:yes stop_codon:yes gene_type:complete